MSGDVAARPMSRDTRRQRSFAVGAALLLTLGCGGVAIDAPVGPIGTGNPNGGTPGGSATANAQIDFENFMACLLYGKKTACL